MEIRERFERLSRLLAPTVRTKLRQAIPLYFANPGSRGGTHSIHQSALAVSRSKFPGASPVQLEFLAFYLLGMAAMSNDGGQSDLGQINSMRLQMLMDRRAKIAEVLSNMMQRIGDTSEPIVGNLK